MSRKASEFIKSLEAVKNGTTWGEGPWDGNHYLFRFFRLWIEGSYGGSYPEPQYNRDASKKYQATANFVKANKKNKQRLRAFAINQFSQFVKVEFDISRPTLYNAMKLVFTTKQIERFNNKLISYVRTFNNENT